MKLERLSYAGIFLGGRGPLIVIREHEAADGTTVRYEINRGDGATSGGICQLQELPARIREHGVFRESGDSIPAARCWTCGDHPCIHAAPQPHPPVLNKSGGSHVHRAVPGPGTTSGRELCEECGEWFSNL